MKKNRPLTYCNPLPIPQIPRGKDRWYDDQYGMFSHENKPSNVTWPDYRSISDPTIFYWEDKWYLYPSYGMAWVSEDFATWQHVRTEPYCPKYSPSIIPWGEKFLMTSWCNPLYESDSPTGPFRELGPLVLPDGSTVLPSDPGIFLDDDGRIYLYEFYAKNNPGTRFFTSQIRGYELDTKDPTKVLRGPVVVAEIDPENRPAERGGNANQNHHFGWFEGPHMLKHNGRYYLITAAPNTEYEIYAMEAFYSDENPLEGFVYQKRNPLTRHTTGIVRGTGHGSVEHGPGNSLWAFYTVAVPYMHMYERRIGMDKVEVDENGELYCPYGVTDTPRIAPGEENAGADIGYLPLNGWGRPKATSEAPGREPIYASDGSSLTYWEPAKDDPTPTLTYDLTDPYVVGAVRIFWREKGLDYGNGILPGAFRYVVEGSTEEKPDEWFPLLDRSASDEEYNVDYRTFEEKECRFVRLRITGAPKGINPAVIDFTIFGYMK